MPHRAEGVGEHVTPPSRQVGLRRVHLTPANAVTLLRVALVPVILVLLVVDGEAARWWAFGVFVFAALSDSVDGWVARRYEGVTPWGQLADPLADKLLVGGVLLSLAVFEGLPWWAVAVILVREVGITLWRRRLQGRGVIVGASIWGKAKTVTQMLAIALWLVPAVSRGLALTVLVIAVVVTVGSGLEYIVRGRGIRHAR